jgi:hypothetical protein
MDPQPIFLRAWRQFSWVKKYNNSLLFGSNFFFAPKRYLGPEAELVPRHGEGGAQAHDHRHLHMHLLIVVA